jgi:hypothetical protein
MTKNIIVSLAILMAPNSALAWGPVGHFTVGLLAQERLTPAAERAVRDLLGNQNLGEVANWADEVRGQGQYRPSTWYHFEKIPHNTKYLDNIKQMPEWQKKKGGVVAALLYGRELLRDPRTPKATKIDILKFIVHFTGDIHQPLHTGLPEDKGGVTMPVDWFGRPSNLHRIWDSSMMMTGHSNFLDYNQPLPVSGAKYVRFLKGAFTPGSVDTKLDIEGWLNESLALRPPLYDPIYMTDQPKYQALHLKTLDSRIFAAGLRLAALLNDTFAGKTLPTPQEKLWLDIENASSEKMEKLINFAP